MSISFDNLRAGHFYHFKNYGEVSEFEVMDIGDEGDILLKDAITKEKYLFSDLMRYGRSNDFELYEIKSKK